MHPTQVAQAFHRDGWVYEEKYDGHRTAAPMQRRRLLQASQGSPGFTRSEPGRSNASATAACTAARGNAPTRRRLSRSTRQSAQ